MLEERLPVLIVDDDDPTQKLVQALLRRHGYESVIAANGAAAIEALRGERFAAVVLDVMMPHVSGLDVIAYMETMEAPFPVIVCTAAPPSVTTDVNSPVVKAIVRKPFCRAHSMARTRFGELPLTLITMARSPGWP